MSEPNKCDLCGLKVKISYDPSGKEALSEEDWKQFRDLQGKNIIPDGYPRNIYIQVGGKHTSDSFDYCAIDSIKWNKNNKCDYFQLRSSSVKLSDHISIHTANKNAKIGKIISFFALGVSSAILLILIYVHFIKNFI